MPGVHLKHCFHDIIQDELWPIQEAENAFLVPFDHLNRRFIDLKEVAFSDGQEENDFKFPFVNLNHRNFDFIQIAIWVGQGPENEFAVP